MKPSRATCTFCQQPIEPGTFSYKGPERGRLCQECLGLAALAYQTWKEQGMKDEPIEGPDYSDYFQTEAWQAAKAGLAQGVRVLDELTDGIEGVNPEDFG